MQDSDLSDIYNVNFAPLDSSIIPAISTALLTYFWLRRGTDDEMPEVG